MMLQTFERRKIDPNLLHGVVVGESENLLLIQREYDFEFDGYMVIRRRDVTKSYAGDSDAYGERLMKQEGLWKRPTKKARLLPLGDWRAIFAALEGKVVVIENERNDAFYIGPILRCDGHAVIIHYFGPCGEWKQPERMPYRAITSMQFGTRYITIHSRHLPPRPSKKSV